MLQRKLLQQLASVWAIALALCTPQLCQAQASQPIIDMHLHAVHADDEGPPPLAICAPYDYWPSWDPKDGMEAYGGAVAVTPPCAHPILSPKTDDELMQETLAIVKARNVTGVASGPIETVDKWKQAGGSAILGALDFNPKTGKPSVDELRALAREKKPVAFAEIGAQYFGVPVNDPRMEPYYALAEELDLPIGIHMGPGPPGTPYFAQRNYRMRNSSMLLLEDVLVKHPKMRVWAMHAGWPLGDDAIAAMYAHPQLFVDIGIIDYAFPRVEFYAYLKRLIDAGFENRIMFGSDEMIWPETLNVAIDNIEKAPMLSPKEKRDILYNNAARFLRLQKK